MIDAQDRPAQTVTELEQRILTILERTNTPGLIGTIVIGGDMVWSGSLGLADRASNRPVTNTTPFRLGFISKTITSLAVLVLQERQVLSLDAILKDIIPEARNDRARTTPSFPEAGVPYRPSETTSAVSHLRSHRLD